jgi:hypothetical protein
MLGCRAGPTDRSAGLLAGRAYLSGTAETLVGGDQGLPMSLKTATAAQLYTSGGGERRRLAAAPAGTVTYP